MPTTSHARYTLNCEEPSKILMIGGDTKPCPPMADCVMPEALERDGAAYDPATDTWRPIAEAPRGIAPDASYAALGDVLYVIADHRLLSYDSAADQWSELPLPPRTRWSRLAAGQDRLVLFSDSDERQRRPRPDYALDPATGRWTRLPDDPLGRTFDRVITSTPAGLILTAKKLVKSPGGEDGPAFVLVARLDRDTGRWTRLPDLDQIGGWQWAWTGTHLVDPTPDGGDGGEIDNYGRTIPYGGRLDPATGAWSPLPAQPKGQRGWPVEALGGVRSVVNGWIYDDAAGTWTRLKKPAGAPTWPGAAAWADDLLMVVGGFGFEPDDYAFSWSTWLWKPQP